MNPNIIIYGFLVFFVCLTIHIFFWKIKPPKNSTWILFLMFLIIPTVIFLWIIIGLENLKNIIHLSVLDLVEILILHLSLSLVYISSYPAAEAVSPSLDIILLIASSEKQKITKENIIKQYTEKKLITERVEDLRKSNIIIEKGECFELKPAGKFMIYFFILYRRILGLPAQGG